MIRIQKLITLSAFLVQAALADSPEQNYQERCAICHDGSVAKAPHRSLLSMLPPETILKATDGGLMKEEAQGLSRAQQIDLAEHLTGSRMGEHASKPWPRCADQTASLGSGRASTYTTWGFTPTNTRHASAQTTKIANSEFAQLKPLWAMKFPGANRARSQPLLTNGVLFVGSHSGDVYALDQDTGCMHWSYPAAGEVRTGFSTATSGGVTLLFFGDVLGNAYALDAANGELRWRARPDPHPNATITGSPTAHGDRVYVPVSSLEVSLAGNPAYECCTFRGSVVAYKAATGERLWQTYTITEPAKPTYKNRAGTQMYGPSGAVIWNSPAIDAARGQLYVGTGENMSSPATQTSDAIFAIGLDRGDVRWVFQATKHDAWNVSCGTDNDHSCPEEDGPDFDFGAAAMLVQTAVGELVVAGQKSGWVHALRPEDGSVVWQQRVGRGGIQGGVHFGLAADEKRIYVPITDMADGRTYDFPDKPGLHALDSATGEVLWYAPAPTDVCGERQDCHPGISQAITVAGNAVLAGGMDGVFRIHDAVSGQLLYDLDTTQQFTTLTGEQTQGGSLGGSAGAVPQDGRVVVSSGYGIYNHMAGNLLLMLAKPGTR